MLRLILLRHAEAAALSGGGDAERALTLTGRAQARVMGDYLASQNLMPDLAVVSAARRARETMKIALEDGDARLPILEEPRLYLAEPHVLLELIRMTPSSVRCLLCVGHNPGFHDYAMQMIASEQGQGKGKGKGKAKARADLQYGLPTAGLIVIDFDAARWDDVQMGTGTLERFITPDDLR